MQSYYLDHSCWNEAFSSPQEAPVAPDYWPVRPSLQPTISPPVKSLTESSKLNSAVMLKLNVRSSPHRAFI